MIMKRLRMKNYMDYLKTKGKGISRQAIYKQIKLDKIKYEKIDGVLFMLVEEENI